jgi:hypothetical protein
MTTTGTPMHTGDHDGRFAKQAGVQCVDVNGTVTMISH